MYVGDAASPSAKSSRRICSLHPRRCSLPTIQPHQLQIRFDIGGSYSVSTLLKLDLDQA